MNSKQFDKLASDQEIKAAVKALGNNGISTILVETGQDAKGKVLALIPKGSEVFTMTSITLDEIGIPREINESGNYHSVRNHLNKMDRKTQGREMSKLGAAPDYTIGSVHAVTQDGKILIASNTGSQLGAYAYGAGNVIFVVGTQKIVKNVDEGIKRIYEYSLPLESERAKKAYGVPGSAVNKLLIINKEFMPKRIIVIFVKEKLGF